jgi:hypothetical protein
MEKRDQCQTHIAQAFLFDSVHFLPVKSRGQPPLTGKVSVAMRKYPLVAK